MNSLKRKIIRAYTHNILKRMGLVIYAIGVIALGIIVLLLIK
jgi:hypothetical protein